MNSLGTEATTAVPPDLWGALLKSASVLCLVLGLIIIILFLLRRFVLNNGKLAQRGMIDMIASYPVGPKERIALINVLGQKILIGITSQQISCLSSIEGDGEFESVQLPVSNGTFFNRLKGAIAKNQVDKEDKQ